jgi:hypothetical protein
MTYLSFVLCTSSVIHHKVKDVFPISKKKDEKMEATRNGSPPFDLRRTGGHIVSASLMERGTRRLI